MDKLVYNAKTKETRRVPLSKRERDAEAEMEKLASREVREPSITERIEILEKEMQEIKTRNRVV